jgi:hypothetical protein
VIADLAQDVDAGQRVAVAIQDLGDIGRCQVGAVDVTLLGRQAAEQDLQCRSKDDVLVD